MISYTYTQTDSEREMRMRLASHNLRNLYKQIGPYISGGFEDNGDGRYSDFDMFMKVNLMNQDSHVYITKELEQLVSDFTIFSGQTITQGSLPGITVSIYDGGFYNDSQNHCTYYWSNVELGNLVIDDNTTVGQFAQAVVENNESFEYNDQITFLFGYNARNRALTPTRQEVRSSASKVILEQDSSELLSAVGVCDGFPYIKGFMSYDGKLSVGIMYDNMNYLDGYYDIGYTWIHSRKEGDKLKVSTQRFGIILSYVWVFLHDESFGQALQDHGYDLGMPYLEPLVPPAAPVLTISASAQEGYDDFIFTCEKGAEMYLTEAQGEEGVEPDLNSSSTYRMLNIYSNNTLPLPQSGQGDIVSVTATLTVVVVKNNLMSPSIRVTVIYDAEGIRTVKLNGEIV